MLCLGFEGSNIIYNNIQFNKAITFTD